MTRFPKPPTVLAALVDPRLEGAACAGMAPLFDDEINRETPAEWEARHHRARALCSRCPVRRHCAASATDLPKQQRRGIWAGHNLTTITEEQDIAA